MKCPKCNEYLPAKDNPSYCMYCGHYLEQISEAESTAHETLTTHDRFVQRDTSFIEDLAPKPDEVQFSIGPYQVLQAIGKGGMGEVLLAYDSSCGRRIALKRIREDLLEHQNLHRRFIKEARITSQLTHPSIIPIYQIHEEGQIYYTMPYVQGQTLKEILKRAKAQEKAGGFLDQNQYSIPSLIRTFISICQAIAYAHSHGILHRDIKPENIIVGKYGEVLILDWGLAKMVSASEKEDKLPESKESPYHEITRTGKVVGTVNYMAPERAFGNPATRQTDIYALGVLLYQILTLRSPFRRGPLSEFRKNISKEELPDPTEVAPYREVPHMLTRIVSKCLDCDQAERYQSAEDLIHDLESFIEGRSEWFPIATLDTKQKEQWEFQENVMIAEHIAITRSTEISDWVNLMITKESFTQNTKIEVDVCICERGEGVGFLLSVPEPTERKHINDGYCLWLASESIKTTMLLRSTVEVLSAPEVFLKQGQTYRVRIEKLDQRLYFYLNDSLQFSYISHIPLTGTHLGILSRDANFVLENFQVYVGNFNIMVNCLAVPDAFLAHKDYTTALTEYRRIGYSFPGRAEGREAMFRAGITLLEEGKNEWDAPLRAKKFEETLEEFEKLHDTPGAPLEYLGKGLVYQALADFQEEAKCYELSIRRYKGHPLLPVLQEQVIWRMHDSSRTHRIAAYTFILLAVRQLPDHLKGKHSRKLFSNLQKHWEPLFFFVHSPSFIHSKFLQDQMFAVTLAFWLARPYVLLEVIKELCDMYDLPQETIANALYALLHLGAWKAVQKILDKNTIAAAPSLQLAIAAHTEPVQQVLDRISADIDERTIFYLIERSLDQNESFSLPDKALIENRELLDAYIIEQHLLARNWEKAAALFQDWPLDRILNPRSPLHWRYGCLLYATEGKEIANIHFQGLLDEPYPQTTTLLSHYLLCKIGPDASWFGKAFLYEKRCLFKQLAVFFRATGDESKEREYRALYKELWIDV